MIKKSAEKSVKNFYRTDRLANERTFLAWIRTNLGIMAFGFIIERFSLVTQQMTSLFGKARLPESHAYSFLFGISLVGMGAVLCIFAFLKFKKMEKQIDDEVYKPSFLLNTLLTLFVFFIGVFLIIYLMNSHSDVFASNKE